MDERTRALIARHGIGDLLTRRVLVVDDDAPNLTVVEATLSPQLTVVTAGSGAEALDVLSRTDVDVIVTDQRMPEMTGVELLERVRTLRPDVAGIVLTGYSDAPAMLSAINRARAFRFLRKPWEPPELVDAVMMACEQVSANRTIAALIDELSRRGDALQQALDRVTDQQRRLLDMERLSSVGRLAAGVTHDLRNALVCLLPLEDELRHDHVPREELADVARAGFASLRNLLDSLAMVHDFARATGVRIALGIVEPADVIRDALAVMRLDLASRTRRIEAQVAPGLPTIVADGQKIVQVLVNLIRNAVQATRDGDHVRVEALPADGGVGFAVDDEGPGIPAAVADHMFEPFVSDKEGRGLGMGLYMARLIVDSHGGSIRAVAKSGRGARIEVRLPPRPPRLTAS